MSGKLFKSTGTIRVRIEPGPTPSDSTNGDDKDGSPSQWAATIFFTPDADSTVRYGDKRYAVFLQESENCLVRKLGSTCEGVPIDVNAALPGLVEAAAQQTLVEVAVQKEDSNLALCAITIPAPGKQK